MGGGIFNNHGSLELTNCVVENNKSAQSGGGIASQNPANVLRVLQSTIRGNEASLGGGIHSLQGFLFVYWSSIVENTAFDTAAINIARPALARITNSTIAGNTGLRASTGAVGTHDGDTAIEQCTLADNWPHAIRARVPESEIVVQNSIINGSCNGFWITTGGGNLEGPGNTCHLVNPGDYFGVVTPLLPLGDYGGSTPTMPPVAGGAASLAVDNSWSNPLCELGDQRGVTRPLDDDGDGWADCDSGAVERTPTDPLFIGDFESGDTSAWSATVP